MYIYIYHISYIIYTIYHIPFIIYHKYCPVSAGYSIFNIQIHNASLAFCGKPVPNRVYEDKGRSLWGYKYDAGIIVFRKHLCRYTYSMPATKASRRGSTVAGENLSNRKLRMMLNELQSRLDVLAAPQEIDEVALSYSFMHTYIHTYIHTKPYTHTSICSDMYIPKHTYTQRYINIFTRSW